MSNLRRLYLERQGEIAHLVIDRPERRNAFTEEMWPTLSGLAEQAEDDDRIKVMVVRGADSTVFCAGADVSEWSERLAREGTGAENGLVVSEAVSAIARMKKPTVAAIRGACMGGGAALAMACDLRVADHTARFSLPPARLGWRSPMSPCAAWSRRLARPRPNGCFSPARCSGAERAYRIGLVSALYEPDFFDSQLDGLLSRMCGMSQASLRTMKEMMRMVAGGQIADDEETERMWRELTTGPDHTEGVRRFLERWR